MDQNRPDRRRSAAQYLRMSTDRQDVSLEFQRRALAKWADAYGYEIVSTFVDEGISGVGIEKRHALKDLLRMVIDGQPNFEAVLVYDVSRWGRFQNPDQAAHYEFMCQEAGVRVEYCAEVFRNDGSAMSGLIKHVKRTMAAEFSREASSRLANAKGVLRGRGFWTGGLPGYGYRRALVDGEGNIVRVCENYERVSLQFCHTRLVLGPQREVDVIRKIYNDYLKSNATFTSITLELNRIGVPSQTGLRWSLSVVKEVLRNGKYKGAHASGRTRKRLGRPAEEIDRRFWVISREVCPAVVAADVWDAVQAKIARGRYVPSRMDLVSDIQRIAAEQGKLSEPILRRHNRYGYQPILREFGGLPAAYEAAGYKPSPFQRQRAAVITRAPKRPQEPKYETVELLGMLCRIWKEHGRLTTDLITATPGVPSPSTFTRRFGTITDAYLAIGYSPNAQQLLMASRKRPNLNSGSRARFRARLE